jgi:hypothetical protein
MAVDALLKKGVSADFTEIRPKPGKVSENFTTGVSEHQEEQTRQLKRLANA